MTTTATATPPDFSTLTIDDPTITNTTPPSHPADTLPAPPPHRSHDPNNSLKRSDPFQFGSRYLQAEDDVFEFNAWDHVETDDSHKEYAEAQYAFQRSAPVSDFDKSDRSPSHYPRVQSLPRPLLPRLTRPQPRRTLPCRPGQMVEPLLQEQHVQLLQEPQMAAPRIPHPVRCHHCLLTTHHPP